MVQTTLNMFDFGVIAIVGLSALLSFFRGFIREVLSLGAWVGASLITLYTFPRAAALIEPQVHSAVIASGLAALGVFLISLIGISLITGMLLKYMKPGSDVGLFDNIVGLTFGTARGVLLVAIAYFIMTLVMQPKDYPDWVKQATTRPYVAEAARYVAKLAPSYLDSVTGKKEEVPLGEKRNTKINVPDMPTMEELQQRVREENEKN